MATLFSLEGPDLLLELPANGPVHIQRKVSTVDTLDGSQTRDLGHWPGGMNISLNTELGDAELAGLTGAVESGIALGLSTGIRTFAVVVARLGSTKLLYGGNAVTLEAVVVKQV